MSSGKDLPALKAEIGANIDRGQLLSQGLSEEQFNWSPEPGRWSIAQNFAHLNIVNGQDLAPLRIAIEAGRTKNLTGTGPFHYGFLSRKFTASMEPPVKRRFKAPRSYVPPAAAQLDKTLAEYRTILAELRELAVLADGLDLARVKTALPALPALLRMLLKMPLGARFEAITAHNRRHLWQVEQLRNELRNA